jgi:carbon-monoxide dehydrogenase large subunit
MARIEDARFLTGSGQYIADIQMPGQAHLAIVRSPHAAALIRSIETAAARAAQGVIAVFTAADIGEELGTTSISFKRKRQDGSPMFWRPQHALARDSVKYVGDPVACVVADSHGDARSAADLVLVEYESLQAIVDMTAAMNDRAVLVWPDSRDNISHIHEMGDEARTERAFAKAAHRVRRQYMVSRVHCQYMEPRGATATYDPLSKRYTLFCDVQSPHQVRDVLAREVLGVPSDKLRVVARDIGGAFGGKHVAIEHRLVLWAAKRLGRPVCWRADRSESIIGDEHGRDNIHQLELALDEEGRFLALRAHWVANVGAYISADRNFQTSFINVPGILGVYRFPTAYVKSTCVMTNTGPLAPYRGAGRPEATFVIERLIDDTARELGIDRIDLRRKNMIKPTELPLRTPLGFFYDCGEFQECMEQALRAADWSSFPERQTESRAKGLLRGAGLSNPIERAGAPTIEYAELRFDPNGKVSVFLGTKNQGQGHETAFVQILGTKLGVSTRDVTYVDGDTDRVAYGNGTFGSRSVSIGGTAITLAADKIIEKGKKIAAHLLEAALADIVFSDSQFSIAGTDRCVSLKEVAQVAFQPSRLPPGIEPGLTEAATWAPPDCTYPYGTHICEVEVDPETGAVRLDRYVVVDDLGVMINPLLVKGQLHGGIVQGAGQALLERMIYDSESGQCLTGSFMDYAMPRAEDFRALDVDHFTTLTERNALGVKGAGEAGAVGALAAVMNAVVDALAPLGVKAFEMPATPARVWQAIHDAHAA